MGAIIIHGGGLVDPSKEVMLRIAKGLYSKHVYSPIYLGKYSFMSLYKQELCIKYTEDDEEYFAQKRGTFFGTCRDVDLTDPTLMEKAVQNLNALNIKTIIVCGGDGSSRQCAEISKEFLKHGINIIFAVPLTVDGINGSWSIGLDQAARESMRQIENVVATSLETYDFLKDNFSVVAVELQGRNRDDILATVLQQIHRKGQIADRNINDIFLSVVPANYKVDSEKLFNQINLSKKRTLILVSEGSPLKVTDFSNFTHRKVRTVIIGHSAQSNGMTSKEDMQNYSDWLNDVTNIISQFPNESYSIVNDGISRWKEDIDYYAKLNPRNCQKANLSKGLETLIKNYMV